MSSFVKFWGTVGGMPGGGRWVASPVDSDSPCVQVRHKGKSYLLDAGSGFARFATSHLNKEPVAGVFFSHFHLDHICGLWLLLDYWQVVKCESLKLVGPRIGDKSLDDVLYQLMQEPVSPAPITWAKVRQALKPELFVMPDGGEWSDGVCTARFVRVVHGAGDSYSIRLSFEDGPVVIYATDVDFGESHSKLVKLCQGADLLIADCEYNNTDYWEKPSPRPHSCPEVVLKVALEAGVKKLRLFHHPYGVYLNRSMRTRLATARGYLKGSNLSVDLAKDGELLRF